MAQSNPESPKQKKKYESDFCNETIVDFMEAMEDVNMPTDKKIALFTEVIDGNCLPEEALKIAKKEKKRIIDSLIKE